MGESCATTVRTTFPEACHVAGQSILEVSILWTDQVIDMLKESYGGSRTIFNALDQLKLVSEFAY